MTQPKISAIAAISKNRVLGKDNKLIYKIPEDQKSYKDITMGHVLIMGRKTFESMGRPLPGRTNIIVTRDQHYEAAGYIVTHSLNEALAEAKKIETEEIFINGGGQIYSEALPITDKLYLTIIDEKIEGDAFFPPHEDKFKKITFQKEGEYDGLKYTFYELEK